VSGLRVVLVRGGVRVRVNFSVRVSVRVGVELSFHPEK
jgi:hypothetical protein